MAKEMWKAGNMLYPVPAVLVSCQNQAGESNMLTIAWTGTVCSDPPMLSISVRKNRASHAMLMETGEFVVNLPTEGMVKELDTAGVLSGKNGNKWELLHLHPEKGQFVSAPMIQECPVRWSKCWSWAVMICFWEEYFQCMRIAASWIPKDVWSWRKQSFLPTHTDSIFL